MVERYVFIKLRDEHATPQAREEIAREAERVFPELPGVVSVAVGMPADEDAAKAWDVSLAVRFESVEAVAGYREHPEHRRFVDDLVKPRLAVLKAWNMAIRQR